MSQITTHILDTSKGIPAPGIRVWLEKNGILLGDGVTDKNGRISDLLPEGQILTPGEYELNFETGEYFEAAGIQSFYPKIVIHFSVFDDSHYHVPLLVSPFGYSTYRGS